MPLGAQEGEEPFSAGELDRFMEDWPAFARWNEERGEEIAVDELSGMHAAATYTRDMERYLANRGWAPRRFFFVAGRVSKAVMAAELAEEFPRALRELEQQREEIRADQDLPPEQKEMMLGILDMQIEHLRAQEIDLGITPAEMELIAPRRDALWRMFEGE